eukprot:746157-Hanusia_phi.AAC.1
MEMMMMEMMMMEMIMIIDDCGDSIVIYHDSFALLPAPPSASPLRLHSRSLLPRSARSAPSWQGPGIDRGERREGRRKESWKERTLGGGWGEGKGGRKTRGGAGMEKRGSLRIEMSWRSASFVFLETFQEEKRKERRGQVAISLTHLRTLKCMSCAEMVNTLVAFQAN